MQEIERKFLVRKDSSTWRSMVSSSSRIAQGYMDCKGATVRIRLRDSQAYLTIKGPSSDNGLSRYEFEKEIDRADAEQLLRLCRGGMIEKTRHLVEYAGHTFEIDEFHGVNQGLVFAEVELESAGEPFERPPFLGPEVTGNRLFYNSHLLRCPYPQWREQVPEEYR